MEDIYNMLLTTTQSLPIVTFSMRRVASDCSAWTLAGQGNKPTVTNKAYKMIGTDIRLIMEISPSLQKLIRSCVYSLLRLICTEYIIL